MADKIRISKRKDYNEQLRLYNSLSKNLNAKLKRLFAKTARQAEQEYIANQDMYYFFTEPFTDGLYKILESHYRLVINTMATRMVKMRRKQDEEYDALVKTYVADVLAGQVTNISVTTEAQIKTIITQAIAGKIIIDKIPQTSIFQIGRLISKNKSFAPYRARMIARTETHSTMNFTNFAISGQLGLNNPVKQWNTASDERVRDWHKVMDNKKVGRDEYFKVLTPVAGGTFTEKRMLYTGDMLNGGPLNVINCRCFTLYYDSEDEIIL